jgi:tetratricopeptide (TPR) repeat protein
VVRGLPLIAVLLATLLVGCAERQPTPPVGCEFVKSLPSEDWLALALRLYADPHRAGELAALNAGRAADAPPPVIIARGDSNRRPPPLYDSLEETRDAVLENAVLRLWARDDTAGALSLLRAALEREPLDPRGRYLLGLAHARRGELNRAVVELESARYLAPTDARPHAALALVNAELGRSAQARRYAFSALQLDWNDWRSHYLMGLLSAGDDEHRLAEAHLFQALELGPSYGPERERILELLYLLQSGHEPLDPAWLSGGLPRPDPRGDDFYGRRP